MLVFVSSNDCSLTINAKESNKFTKRSLETTWLFEGRAKWFDKETQGTNLRQQIMSDELRNSVNPYF